MKLSKNIPADTKRSVLQHLMFGVLAVLILLNWTVHRPMEYEEFSEAFENSNTVIDGKSKDFQKVITAIAKEEGGDYENGLDQKASKIVSSSKILVESLDSAIKLLGASRARHLTDKDRRLCDFAMDLTRNYYTNIVELMGSNDYFFKFLPLNDKSLKEYKILLNIDSFAIEYRTRKMMIAAINSLKNDVINVQEMLVYYLFDRIHENGCNFGRGYRPIYILNEQFFTQNEKFNIEIVNGNFWGFSKRFSKVKVDKGYIDVSELNTEMIAYWHGKATELGKNVVQGSISKIFRSDTIIEPFSFSYFVSAPGIALHVDKSNIIYAGVLNPLSISVPGFKSDKIKLRVAGAKVTKTSDGKFEIFFDKIPAGKVYAYVDATNAQGRTSTVHSMELKVQNLPAPVTNFEAYKESGIAVDSFFAIEKLEVFSADSAFAMDYEVISFKVEGFISKHQYFGPVTVYGEEFSGNHELVSIFNTISAGDRLILSDIKVRVASGRMYEAAPISISLK